MLSKILIKNYILIDELELDLSDGLNIITGETGAGKSILINAIDIAFGGRGANKEIIKNGADKALIEITILNKKQNVTSLFEEYGIESFGDEIILSREITPTSNRARVNGSLVNQEFMKRKQLGLLKLDRGYAWLDTGTHDSLSEASIFVEVIEKRQGLKIACLEGIAYRKGWITREKMQQLAKPMLKNQYGQYLLKVINELDSNSLSK